MLLERRHPAQHALVVEVRSSPLYCLYYIGTRLMNELTDMGENRPRELSRPLDVGVYARIPLAQSCRLTKPTPNPKPRTRSPGSVRDRTALQVRRTARRGVRCIAR